MRGIRAFCDWLSPQSDDDSSDGDLAEVEVVDDGGPGGPGGDAGGAAVLADPAEDAPTVKQAPQGDPQVVTLDSF